MSTEPGGKEERQAMELDTSYDGAENGGIRKRPIHSPSVNSISSTGSMNSYHENTPLVLSRQVYDLTRSLSHAGWEGQEAQDGSPPRVLGWIGGVFAAVALAQYSTNLFLRVGFVVGQAGMLQAIVHFMLAYLILYLTILSICAISTNGAIEGGGAYYMISRALGPEFGGSIGLLFFLANVFSCALYVSGFVEGLTDNFGPSGTFIKSGPSIPVEGHWWPYLYSTLVLAFCLLVCLIGGAMFARTSVFILGVVVICTLSLIISTFIKDEKCVNIPYSNKILYPNGSIDYNHTCRNYTGYSIQTFENNLYSNYTRDYITLDHMDFVTVFAILFSSVTGIMNGANMSGELRDPGKAIPKGTLSAAGFTFGTYLILAVITAFTCSRELLVNDYNYLQDINVWPPFVVIGTFAATLSAALGNLIGASRVLWALGKDQLFGVILKPAAYITQGGNPIIAVLITWFLVQLVLMIGSLNAIAPITSIFFLLSYASVNLACLALELASAPNFRPTFRYFSWWTALPGMISCLAMCFLINAVYSAVAIIIFMVLIIVLHLRTLEMSWGSISQALIFHQVRKYLLMLDTRKEHVKFWRPQILLLVQNPRTSCDLIEFVNDIKKSGLYVLGHVKTGTFDNETIDPCQIDLPKWQALVDNMKIKAFIELTLANSVRDGMHHLIRVSGLGGMKPNTICLGFYDSNRPEDAFIRRRGRKNGNKFIRKFYTSDSENDFYNTASFPEARSGDSEERITDEEYVYMIKDVLKLNKNLCLCRHFHKLDRHEIVTKKGKKYIDVWPVNLFRPDTASCFDNTCLFMLQLACILHMVPGWKDKTELRIFLVVNPNFEDTDKKEKKLRHLLHQLRIIGEIVLVQWEHVTKILTSQSDDSGAGSLEPPPSLSIPIANFDFPEEYLDAIHNMIKSHCNNTAVVFTYLPIVPPRSDMYVQYRDQLDAITKDLPPTVMVHGIHPVTSTTL